MTTTIVSPSAHRPSISCRISSRVRSSRVPVGSSARRTLGFFTSARDRHTRLLTAGEFTGSMVRALGEVDLRQRRADPFFPLGTRESQRLESDVDVLRRGEGGDEVERLEHEPDVLRSDARERAAGLACQIRFSEEDAPRCRGVEGTENLEEG